MWQKKAKCEFDQKTKFEKSTVNSILPTKFDFSNIENNLILTKKKISSNSCRETLSANLTKKNRSSNSQPSTVNWLTVDYSKH